MPQMLLETQTSLPEMILSDFQNDKVEDDGLNDDYVDYYFDYYFFTK